MKKTNLKKWIPILAVLLLLLTVSVTLFVDVFAAGEGSEGAQKTGTLEKSGLVDDLLACSTRYVVVKHKQLGGSHYAYTDALAETKNDPAPYSEYNFEPGAQLVLLTLEQNADGSVSTFENVLYATSRGVVRDPDVSADGTKILFSLKKSTNDDFHLYEMDLATREMTQLTFGSGQSDIEPKYLANGNIVFTSNRCVQTVDCWYTPVCNLYILYRESGEIVRVSYDQVHDTYPTVTSDGRVLYTRWDYNDRNQMFIQSVFQMFQDGTAQTEVYGNDSSFPTTLLHTREVPGKSGLYVSIASGHHMYQYGKLVLVDTNEGRNSADAVRYVFPDKFSTKKKNIDTDGYREGKVYKYPYAISESEFIVSTADSYSGTKTVFDICLMNTEGECLTLCKGSIAYPASQIVPIKSSTLFDRTAMTDHSSDTASYYVANVYDGAGMTGVEKGSAKYLRVVTLGYREAAIGATVGAGTGTSDPYSPIATGNGAWDVKAVLGIVPVEEDGSVFFHVPSKTPVYFQLLDKNGDVIQTMRSWSTLQPGETFSCVGCHVEKNQSPVAGSEVTVALRKGAQNLQKDLWMEENPEYADYDPYTDDPIGFSYLRQVQSILDESCVGCHSDTDAALKRVDASKMGGAEKDIAAMNALISEGDLWTLTENGAAGQSHAPFGKSSTAQKDINTVCDGSFGLQKKIKVTQYDKEAGVFSFTLRYSGHLTLAVDGQTVYEGNAATVVSETVPVSSDYFTQGENTVTVTLTDCSYFDGSLYCGKEMALYREFLSLGSEWSYVMDSSVSAVPADWKEVNFDDSTWEKGYAPFGDRNNDKTKWSASNLLWLRQSFTVDNPAAMENGEFGMKLWYDDNIKVYLNGKEIFSEGGWVDGYTTVDVKVSGTDFIAGKNVLAVSMGSTGSYGGSELDLSFFGNLVAAGGEERTSTAPISFESYPITGKRMKKAFPLSYLVLTGSRTNGGQQWVGSTTGRFTSWISSMSECEILAPYTAGAFKSGIIEKLREGHGNLTDRQIRTIACWIDLGVPCYADYREGNRWNGNEVREYEEKNNKRGFYDEMDALAEKRLGEAFTEAQKLTVGYQSADGKATLAAEGLGYAILYVDRSYADGDKITVKLPAGEHYLGVTLSSRMGEGILYLPEGEWSYTFAGLSQSYPGTMTPKNGRCYIDNTILVRLVDEEEAKESRNLALNPYDQTETNGGAYPHVTADSYYGKQAEFAPRNVVDGFSANDAHGTYPYQSWGTENSDRHWLQVDFGREVTLDRLELVIRADFSGGHDTHFTSVTVEMSDGSEKTFPLYRTADAIVLDLGGVKTSSVKLKGFVRAEKTWAAVSELRAFGCEG